MRRNHSSSVDHPCPAVVDNSCDCFPCLAYSVFPIQREHRVASARALNSCPPSRGLLLSPEGSCRLRRSNYRADCEDWEPETAMTGWRRYAWAALEPVAPLLR